MFIIENCRTHTVIMNEIKTNISPNPIIRMKNWLNLCLACDFSNCLIMMLRMYQTFRLPGLPNDQSVSYFLSIMQKAALMKTLELLFLFKGIN